MNRLRPIKLLMVIDEMEVGGTQRQIVNIACGLDRQRFDATLVYFMNRSHLVVQLEQCGVTVHQIPKRGRLDARFMRRMRSFLQDQQFDVMHCFSFSAETWATAVRRLLPRHLRPALITSVRGTYEWYSGLQWLIKRWVTFQSLMVVSNSRSGAAFAATKMRVPLSSLEVIYNGVVASDIAPEDAARLRAELTANQVRPLIVFIGRLVDHKDLQTLLRAANRLARSNPTPLFVLVGEGPERDKLQRMIDEFELHQCVRLLGERSDAAALIAAGDMLVLPSVREGLSNVVLEAMTAGIPVIASRAGGNVELINDGVDGVLFDVGDDAALAAAITALINDSAQRARLGAAAKLRAQRDFGVGKMIMAMSDCYTEASMSLASVQQSARIE